MGACISRNPHKSRIKQFVVAAKPLDMVIYTRGDTITKMALVINFRWMPRDVNWQFDEFTLLDVTSNEDSLDIMTLSDSISQHIADVGRNVGLYKLVYNPIERYDQESDIDYISRTSELRASIYDAYKDYTCGKKFNVMVLLENMIPTLCTHEYTEIAIFGILYLNEWLQQCEFITSVYLYTGIIVSKEDSTDNLLSPRFVPVILVSDIVKDVIWKSPIWLFNQSKP